MIREALLALGIELRLDPIDLSRQGVDVALVILVARPLRSPRPVFDSRDLPAVLLCQYPNCCNRTGDGDQPSRGRNRFSHTSILQRLPNSLNYDECHRKVV